jgi:hypothetical protein
MIADFGNNKIIQKQRKIQEKKEKKEHNYSCCLPFIYRKINRKKKRETRSRTNVFII